MRGGVHERQPLFRLYRALRSLLLSFENGETCLKVICRACGKRRGTISFELHSGVLILLTWVSIGFSEVCVGWKGNVSVAW